MSAGGVEDSIGSRPREAVMQGRRDQAQRERRPSDAGGDRLSVKNLSLLDGLIHGVATQNTPQSGFGQSGCRGTAFRRGAHFRRRDGVAYS